MNIVELGRRYAHAQEGALALGFDANLATLADGLSKFPRLSHVQHGRRPPRRVIFKTANVQVVRQLLLEQTPDNIIEQKCVRPTSDTGWGDWATSVDHVAGNANPAFAPGE